MNNQSDFVSWCSQSQRPYTNTGFGSDLRRMYPDKLGELFPAFRKGTILPLFTILRCPKNYVSFRRNKPLFFLFFMFLDVQNQMKALFPRDISSNTFHLACVQNR